MGMYFSILVMALLHLPCRCLNPYSGQFTLTNNKGRAFEVYHLIANAPECSKTGFLVGVESINMEGYLYPVSTPSESVEIYLELENKTLLLMCDIDFKRTCKQQRCQWKYEKKEFHFVLKFLVQDYMKNSTLLITTTGQDRNWKELAEPIKTYALIQTVTIKDKKINLEPKCRVTLKANSEHHVEFCVRNLKDVKIAMYKPLSPTHFENGPCIRKAFTIPEGDVTIQMNYFGACKVVGSMTCTITGVVGGKDDMTSKAVNETHKSKTPTQTTSKPAEESDNRVTSGRILLLFILLDLGFVIVYLTYRLCVSSDQPSPEVEKKDNTDIKNKSSRQFFYA